MYLKKIYKGIADHLNLSQDTPITDFDETYTGHYEGYDISASYRTKFEGNDEVEQLKIVWMDHDEAVGFETERYDYEKDHTIRFGVHKIDLDPLGGYEVSRNSVGSSLRFIGNIDRLVKQMKRGVRRNID